MKIVETTTKITYSFAISNLLQHITVNIIGKYNPDILEKISKYNLYYLNEYGDYIKLFQEGRTYYLVSKEEAKKNPFLVTKEEFVQDEKVFKRFVDSFVYIREDTVEPIYYPWDRHPEFIYYNDIIYSSIAVKIVKFIIDDELYFKSNIMPYLGLETLNEKIREIYFNDSKDKKLINELDKVIHCIAELFQDLDDYAIYRYKIKDGVIVLEYIEDSRILEWKMLKENINPTKKNKKEVNKEYLSVTEYYLNNNPISFFVYFFFILLSRINVLF